MNEREEFKRLQMEVKKHCENLNDSLKELEELRKTIKGDMRKARIFFRNPHYCPICGNLIDPMKDRDTSIDSMRYYKCKSCDTKFGIRVPKVEKK